MIKLQNSLWHKFGVSMTVADSGSLKTFSLLVSFGQCKFRLSEHAVGLILKFWLGGSPSEFAVEQVSDRDFKFNLSCKIVALHILKLEFFRCPLFKVFFKLLRSGGADWQDEVHQFEEEESNSWQTITHKRRRNHPFMLRLQRVGLGEF